MAPSPARTISCKAWNTLVEYPSKECKHDLKEFEGNMSNPIFKENVQGRKHPGSCAFVEPELHSYRKPKREVQNEKNGDKTPNNNHYDDENHDEIELYQGNSKRSTYWHSIPEQRTPSSIDCEGVQLTNAQCLMVPISILWSRESWTIHLKYTFETKQYHIIQQATMATPIYGMCVS